MYTVAEGLSSGAEEFRVRISAEPGESSLSELWARRELLYFLAWRDVKIRYKQTVIGALWAVLQPLLTMLVFSIVFGRLAKLPSAGLPYDLFCFSALLPWMFFANGLTKVSNSLIGSENLIKKVYIPRLIIPTASLGSDLLDLGCSTVMLLLLMAWHRVVPGAPLLLLPVLVIQLGMVTLGLGCWLAALNVQYRDVKYVVPFILQFLLFLTPVAYASTLIPEQWRLLYAVNPMVGVIEEFRWAFLNIVPSANTLWMSGLTSLLTCAGGISYFKRKQQDFADHL